MLLNLFGLWQQLVVGGSGASGSKRVYIERDGQILVFDKANHAAAYLAAQKSHISGIKHSKATHKRHASKVVPTEVITLDATKLLADKFAVPEWQTAALQHDYETLYRLHQHLLMLQDEEDIELILLAA